MQRQFAVFLSTHQPKFALWLIMQLLVNTTVHQQVAILAKPLPEGVSVIFTGTETVMPDADLYMDFCYEENGYYFSTIKEKPVLVNAVIDTSEKLPENAIRFNGWNSFWERPLLEIAGTNNYWLKKTEESLQQLGWLYKIVPDIPGMVAARVVAMIINEAYYGWEDAISSRAEIDTAMKLGTNYPFGPFEWCERIGIQKVHALLARLATTHQRYAPAPMLTNEAKSY